MILRTGLAAAAALALAACGGGEGQTEGGAANVSEDPYGATGAPGADMTDNGVTDGANGMADDDAVMNDVANTQ